MTTAVRKLKSDGRQLLSELCQEPNTAQHEHKLCNICTKYAHYKDVLMQYLVVEVYPRNFYELQLIISYIAISVV